MVPQGLAPFSLDKLPVHLLETMAEALNTSVMQLLGIEEAAAPHGNSRLMKQLKKLESLPKADQKVVIQMIDALAQSRKVKA